MSDPNREAEDSALIHETDPFLPYLREINLTGKGLLDTFSFETFLEMVRSRRGPAMVLHHDSSIFILKTVKLRGWHQGVDEASQRAVDGLRDGDLVLDVIGDDIRMYSHSEEEEITAEEMDT